MLSRREAYENLRVASSQLKQRDHFLTTGTNGVDLSDIIPTREETAIGFNNLKNLTTLNDLVKTTDAGGSNEWQVASSNTTDPSGIQAYNDDHFAPFPIII
jgi:hypothetical protein